MIGIRRHVRSDFMGRTTETMGMIETWLRELLGKLCPDSTVQVTVTIYRYSEVLSVMVDGHSGFRIWVMADNLVVESYWHQLFHEHLFVLSDPECFEKAGVVVASLL